MDVGGGGGGTLSDLYQSAKKLLLRARDGIGKLERFESAMYSSSSSFSSRPAMPFDSHPELSFATKKDLGQVQSLCAEMDRLWRSIPSKRDRDLWKRKVEQLAGECDSLKESLERISVRQQSRMQEAKERAELIERANGDGEHVLSIFDDEAQAMRSARNSHMMIEEAYATGVAILSKYAEQKDHLKQVQRKALDVLNHVGLSNSVLKLIERRHRVDKWVAYTGMAITVIVVYMFWSWTH
ncbi:uncharacterized protein A4U43_C07F33350 [Asparagus officinalis]|uniref:Membrin n=1 Tax=Asparagus officinalis TaxID=4686 RepID=A0A5P1EGQ3_ASPOF|nr:membrin-11 [Asparagus officinalis]ONK65076.1 uncharacterized protein A4U43_C07F33350 [Asparagus officinalis]